MDLLSWVDVVVVFEVVVVEVAGLDVVEVVDLLVVGVVSSVQETSTMEKIIRILKTDNNTLLFILSSSIDNESC